MYRIVVNKIRCRFCGDILESHYRHDFVRCHCGKCANDGGQDYTRRAFFTEKPEDCYEDLSIYLDTETGKLVPASEANQEDIPGDTVRVEIKEVEVPDEVPTLETPETEKPEPTPVPTLDIPEVTEAVKAEPVKSEERALQNEDKLKKKAKQVARIKELKAEGKSFYDISKELNLPEATVRQYFKQNV